MSVILGVRRQAVGWAVGAVHARKRRGRYALELRQPLYLRNAEDALETLRNLMAGTYAAPGPKRPRARAARARGTLTTGEDV